jgi:hypothetical protein
MNQLPEIVFEQIYKVDSIGSNIQDCSNIKEYNCLPVNNNNSTSTQDAKNLQAEKLYPLSFVMNVNYFVLKPNDLFKLSLIKCDTIDEKQTAMIQQRLPSCDYLNPYGEIVFYHHLQFAPNHTMWVLSSGNLKYSFVTNDLMINPKLNNIIENYSKHIYIAIEIENAETKLKTRQFSKQSIPRTLII